MSNLADPEGDDFPAAAAKNLDDANALLAASRTDGAGYLAGYVRECSLKAVIVLDFIAREVRLAPGTTLKDALTSSAPADQAAVEAGRMKGLKEARKHGHKLGQLSAKAQALAAVPGGAVARYILPPNASSALEAEGWRETLRYRAAGIVDASKASRWVDDAKTIYLKTVGAMRRDGVVFG